VHAGCVMRGLGRTNDDDFPLLGGHLGKRGNSESLKSSSSHCSFFRRSQKMYSIEVIVKEKMETVI
jgi:hypothetical protein